MSFDKMIQYKALHQIYGTNGARILDHLLENAGEIEKMKMKNVCALISVQLFVRLENTCGFLSMSKREFIESALIEALDRADKILENEGVFEHFEAVSNQTEVV